MCSCRLNMQVRAAREPITPCGRVILRSHLCTTPLAIARTSEEADCLAALVRHNRAD